MRSFLQLIIAVVCLPAAFEVHAQTNPPTKTTAKDIDAAIDNLAAAKFRDREIAMMRLTDLGEPAAKRLLARLDGTSRERDQRIVRIFVSMLKSEDKTAVAAAEGALEQLLESKNDAITRQVAGAVGDLEKLAVQRLQRLGASYTNRNGRATLSIPKGWKHGEKPLSALRWLGRLYQLTVSGVEMSDDSLAHLKHLNQLQYLNIRLRRDVTKAGLRHLERKWAMRSLYLTFYRDTPVDLPDLSKMPQLYYFSISGGKLTTKGIATLAGHPRLSNLAIREATLPKDAIRSLQKLTNLSYLTIWGCNVPAADQSVLANFKRLRSLYLTGSSITDDSLRHLKSLDRLTYLDVSGTPITGSGLKNLTALKNLRSLMVHYSNLENKHVPQLFQMKSITSISLAGTRVTGEGLKGISALPKLRSLDLSYRPIGDDDLRHLAPLKSLQTLNLTHTRITDAGLQHLKQLPALRNVYAGHSGVSKKGLEKFYAARRLRFRGVSASAITNPIPDHRGRTGIELLKGWKTAKRVTFLSTSSPNDLGLSMLAVQLPMLEELALHGKSITDKGTEHLSKFGKLRGLSLDYATQLTDKSIEHLARLKGLTQLSLTGSKLSTNGLVKLKDLKLQSLSLGMTTIDDRIADTLSGLPDLKKLELPSTAVTDKICATIKSLAKLETLVLSRTKISDTGVAQLSTLKNLRQLVLQGTGVSSTAVDALKKKLPNCVVTR